MTWKLWLRLCVGLVFGILSGGIACAPALAQVPAGLQQEGAGMAQSAPDAASGTVDLDWTPPAFAQLSAQASTRSSFALDRTMLTAAAGLMGNQDAETKQAVAKIDGVSVHLLRFAPAGVPDEAVVDAIREAYHVRRWKHLISNVGPVDATSPLHNRTTDLWLQMEGVDVRGAVVLVESPNSVTLITMAGDLSPVDILHLRGHFGIPRFDGNGFKDARSK